MDNCIMFREDRDKHGVILFVKSYRPKSWLRKEKIEYTIDTEMAERFDDNTIKQKICDRIKKDFPNAEIWCEDYCTFFDRMVNHRFFVIGRWREDGTEEYYCDGDRDGKPEYCRDLENVRFILSERSADETLRTIRKSTRDRAYTRMVFLMLVNELLSPCMMITCTSKGSGVTKYYSREEGKRLRLVTTSNAAAKFDYESVLRMYEYLHQRNKNFLYSVVPVFKDNVNCKDIEKYIRENHISRMVVMDLKLKHLKRQHEG